VYINGSLGVGDLNSNARLSLRYSDNLYFPSLYGVNSFTYDDGGAEQLIGAYFYNIEANWGRTDMTGLDIENISYASGTLFGGIFTNYSWNTSTASPMYGLYSFSQRSSPNSPVYGIYSEVAGVSGGAKKWAGYFTGGDMYLSGNFGIGTANPTHKLTVNGGICATSIKVAATVGADFVFEPSYKLRPLAEVEQFITTNKHLPEIAPADSMVQNGVDMGNFQVQLLQKVEELTLYIIEQDKKIEGLKNEVENLKKEEE
jgi:hypothetical protein